MSDLNAFVPVQPKPRGAWLGPAALSAAAVALAATLAFALFLVWQWREESRMSFDSLRSLIVAEPQLRTIVAGASRPESGPREAEIARAVVELIKIELPPLIAPITVVPVEATPAAAARAESDTDLVLRQTIPFPRTGSDGSGEIERAVALLTAAWRKHVANGACTLQVDGHTDTKGSDEANLQLSERRAQFVAKILVKELGGVPMAINGWGERRLLVLTPDATDELMNRRVDVMLTCPATTVAMNETPPN